MLDLVSISNKLSISCWEILLIPIQFYWFFHGLMISEKNINKNNIKWFTRTCSQVCCSSALTKKNVLTEICFVLLAFIFPDLVSCWRHIIKQILPAFLFNIEIIIGNKIRISLFSCCSFVSKRLKLVNALAILIKFIEAAETWKQSPRGVL